MTHLGQIDIFVNSLSYRLSESGAAGACLWDWQMPTEFSLFPKDGSEGSLPLRHADRLRLRGMS